MKSFVANGTGSQQTLTDSQDNKIPVYDSVTDAEADLANLAENQIIATHDTGSELSAPVDTVQSGNMHAVTSNAVAEMFNTLGITKIKTGLIKISVGSNLNINIDTRLTTVKHISITPASNAGLYPTFYVTRGSETKPTVNVTYTNSSDNAVLRWIAFGD